MSGPTPTATTSAPQPQPVIAADPNNPPPSVVADHPYPNVKDTTEDQQAATAPGTGEAVTADSANVPFKEQVNGYAKIIAGTIFNKPHEKELGQAKLDGTA